MGSAKSTFFNVNLRIFFVGPASSRSFLQTLPISYLLQQLVQQLHEFWIAACWRGPMDMDHLYSLNL
jgi:hypothetical protein